MFHIAKMTSVATLSFWDARSCVIDRVIAARGVPATEQVGLDCAAGRVLAEDAHADRDYPPLARSVRDGFAVRASDTPARLRVIGEVRAGEVFVGQLSSGEAVEIMTGAPIPTGADAVVMVEHSRGRTGQLPAPRWGPGKSSIPKVPKPRTMQWLHG